MEITAKESILGETAETFYSMVESKVITRVTRSENNAGVNIYSLD